MIAVTPDKYEYYTPQWIVDIVKNTLGELPDLDPCGATHQDKQITARKVYCLPDEDGKELPWYSDTLFMNPPYGSQIESWIMLFHDAWKYQISRTAFLLIPVKMDTRWWDSLIDIGLNDMMAFVGFHGRVSFNTPEGMSNGKGTFASALMIFTRNRDDLINFCTEAKKHGRIYRGIL